MEPTVPTGMVDTLLSGVQTEVLAGIASGLPAAGAVFAAVAGIMIAVKIFKKVSGARA